MNSIPKEVQKLGYKWINKLINEKSSELNENIKSDHAMEARVEKVRVTTFSKSSHSNKYNTMFVCFVFVNFLFLLQITIKCICFLSENKTKCLQY